MASEHGTYVNGRKVHQVELEHGDEISFGLGRNIRMGGSIPDVAIRASFRIEEERTGPDGKPKYKMLVLLKSVTEISNKPTPGGKVLSPEAVKILLEKLDSVRADADTPLDEVIGPQTERKLAAANQMLVDERSSFEKSLAREEELRKQLQEAAYVLRSSVKKPNHERTQKDGAGGFFVCPSCGWKEDSADQLSNEVKPDTRTRRPLHSATRKEQIADTPASSNLSVTARSEASDVMYFSEWTGTSTTSNSNSNRIKKILKFDESANKLHAYEDTKSQSQLLEASGAVQISDSHIYPPPDLLAQLDQELAKSSSTSSLHSIVQKLRTRDELREDPLSLWSVLLSRTPTLSTPEGGSRQIDMRDLIVFGRVWKGLMEERLRCYRAEIVEMRMCDWNVLKKYIDLGLNKKGELIAQMRSFDPLAAGDELSAPSQILGGISKQAAERAGEVTGLLYHWASLQVQLWELGKACRHSRIAQVHHGTSMVMTTKVEETKASQPPPSLQKCTSSCLLAILLAVLSSPLSLGDAGEDQVDLTRFPPVPLTRHAVIEQVWQHPDHELTSDPAFPEYVELLSDLGELIAVPDRRHDAIKLIRWGKAQYPQFSSPNNYLAVSLMRLGGDENLQEAQELLEDAVESWNLDMMAQNNLGVVWETRGRLEDAYECYQFAIEGLDQECFLHLSCIINANKVLLNMARMHQAKKDYRSAARFYQLAARLYERISGCSYPHMQEHVRGRGAFRPCKDVAAARYSRSLEHLMTAMLHEEEGNKSMSDKSRRSARRYLLQSLVLPDFFFDPPRQILTREDEPLVRRLRFESIFQRKFWSPESESASGPGSNADMTAGVQELLHEVMTDLGLSSLLDIGCGDWFWMSRTNLTGVRYVGVDIVHDIIASNIRHVQQRTRECAGGGSSPGGACSFLPRSVRFGQEDAVQGLEPAMCEYQEEGQVRAGCELIFVKEVLIHLTINDIKKVLDNIQNLSLSLQGNPHYSTKQRYLLVTHDSTVKVNNDETITSFSLPGGGWRPVNLYLQPFLLPPALVEFEQGFSLWKLPFE
ncbi:hypothetical protein GUITHDRAFT_135660 [Guillardia theta CCMP2712]|uniref:FHA domain-containing protein n=1 Tax=Guillardia theta (strain CCMP2712) TaxID=905079 RepID=L1JNW7_GUITC|nr:hypothetical protein GUITHDRAFT_135660 [Guillardia theta CCMP2712]EKX49979.1 hypothetical protein GUITHDRAFT_135660 [Guillardia theta CCMP2712]|eukprot:XP_005836959.1 hypothetical protein GUITHDRAFT_135660 [Guillardia theta CCMP2712]